jgi:hypothetical protein
MTDPTRLVPDAAGSFAQVRQPDNDTSIRPPATLRHLDGRDSNAPTAVVIDQARIDEVQADPRPSMRNPRPR